MLTLFVLPVAIAGYAAMANVKGASPRFAMTCLMATGLYAAVPCILVWNSNNSAGHYKRATTSALQLAVANCGGFVASELRPSCLGAGCRREGRLTRPGPAFVYPQDDGPFYHRGHTIILGLLCYAWIA